MAAAGEAAVGGAVAARVPVLQDAVVQPRAGALLDAPPDVLRVDRPVVLPPARRVAHVGGRLEAEHPKAGVAVARHDAGDLVHVARRHGHVVREEAADAVLGAQPREHVAEAAAEGVELGLAPGTLGAPASAHGRVEVAGEGQVAEAGPTRARVERQGLEVLVVEVAVRHRHRLAARVDHRLQGGGVVVGREQAHLAADELGGLPGPAFLPQQPHLRPDGAHGVPAVDRDPVGVARVVAGRAGEVAAGEDRVGALASGDPPAEHLARSAHRHRQLVPAPGEGGLALGLHRPGGDLDPADGAAGGVQHGRADPVSCAHRARVLARARRWLPVFGDEHGQAPRVPRRADSCTVRRRRGDDE